MEIKRSPLLSVLLTLSVVAAAAVCILGTLHYTSSEEKDVIKSHLVPRYHTVKLHINKFSHIIKEESIRLPEMREGYRVRRNKIEDGVMHLRSRAAVLRDYLPTDESVQKYQSLREDGQVLNQTFGTCAMVHSSGFMSNSKLGSQIDIYDAVFRLDADPTVDYVEDVGQKTTFRVASSDSISRLVDDSDDILSPSETLVLHGSEHVFSLGLTPKKIASLNGLRPDVSIFRMTNGFEVAANNIFKTHTNITRKKTELEFSSGFHALLLMLDLCQDVHLFGVIPNSYCTDPTRKESSSFKYYQTELNLIECEVYRALEAMGKQRPFKERDVIERLAKDGRVTVKRPVWT